MSSAAQQIQQPTWHKPTPATPVLKISNSLTHTKTEFVPRAGMNVGWYICGPTVYAPSHLGHARTYMTFDIIRRIMEEYFGYHITYVMNITDIDDKIIITARQNYLFDQKMKSLTALTPSLVDEVEEAWGAFLISTLGKGKRLPEGATMRQRWEKVKSAPKPTFEEMPKFEMWVTAATRSLAAIDKGRNDIAAGHTGRDLAQQLLEENRDTLSKYIDDKLGRTVTDPVVFRDYAYHWEKQYFKDMDALGVRRPDVLTRVSEYVPEIVKFVEGIIANGYGYESEGSVYFDTPKFDRSPKHSYAKLEPWSASNVKLLQEGEGDLAVTSGARNKADFALWKASKPGEPSWDSPWGKGRPGWHIECSAMCGDVLGEKLDIHSGGIDLAFPHHDNEVAQSEACFDCDQWVNYFMHAGHLHIDGQKMSKSLKNFTTIEETLENFPASTIRIMFLLHSWDSVLDYKQSTLQEARVFESTINNFLTNAKALLSEIRSRKYDLNGVHNFHDAEKALLAHLDRAQVAVHAALSDNFDTSTVMNTLRDLITAANTYTSQRKSLASADALFKVARFVTRMMRIFGVYRDANPAVGDAAGGGRGAGGSLEETAGPYVRLLASFRDRVRALVRSGAPASEMLALTDTLRDQDLVDLGVALDDRDDGTALVKFMDRDVILRQREEKRVATEKAKAEREEVRRAERAKEAEKIGKGKLNPREMFRTAEFSRWDDKGVPTHKADGEEVSKSGVKKLIKQWEAQEKLHEKYLKFIAENGGDGGDSSPPAAGASKPSNSSECP
ncbi:hypothetical protein HK101_008110 [Irineochytrium annulatum]|nr:hypothetical protein HK101_008110 [Irineochytrium annulatum]